MRPAIWLSLLVLMPLTGCFGEEEIAGIGAVKTAKPEAEVVSGAKGKRAEQGMQVLLLDELVTRKEGRLQVDFIDDSRLILGENAKVVVDSYVYDPQVTAGQAALRSTGGALRFISGKLTGGDRIGIETPVATISLRGTELWAGPIDGRYGVLLLKGEVVVENAGGSVTLSEPGEGTDIRSSSDAPSPPARWPDERVARALATVSLP